ncbi:MAG TPA: dUTP diphosphatase [Pseudomonadaceae bacterium]|nr:dUTP diphosphatase [Pseudomonadaceae bacterium]
MLTPSQAQTMLTLQARMNARVNPDWVRAGYPYLRAVVVEGAEAMEHKGWKWWKHQDCDLPQLQMELVDIWHFMLSHLLLEQQGDEAASLAVLLAADSAQSVLFDGSQIELASLDVIDKLELTIGLAAARRLSLPLFASLLHDCEMSWQDLYRQYVGKNVLNFFRQDHGYKEGSYRKLWDDGREDNEHLVDIMTGLDAAEDGFQHLLYDSLKDRYEKSR